jgi:hypothetical protein
MARTWRAVTWEFDFPVEFGVQEGVVTCELCEEVGFVEERVRVRFVFE